MTLWAVGILTLVACLGLFIRRGRHDPTTILTIFLVATFGVSAHWIIRPLGAVGQPSLLVGLACMWWWGATKVLPDSGLDRRQQPIRTALLAYGWFFACGYAIAHTRPLTSLEGSGSVRALILLASLIGIALLAADGIGDRSRLDALLHRMVSGATFMGIIGLVQFFSGFDPSSSIRPPLLGLNRDVVSIGIRSNFNRPFGTALHPIEFGVVLGALLPLALHYALHRPSGSNRRLAWLRVAIIAGAVPTSLSRSGIISLAVGLTTLLVVWGWRRRAEGILVGGAFAVMMWVVIPGLLGSIRSLFTSIEYDPSYQARIDRVPRVVELWSQRPFLGRGYGTYSPQDYFLLDNEFYRTLIESGVLGVLVLTAMLLVALAVARGVSRRSRDPATRHLSQAMAAGVLAIAASIPTFDAFFYRILTGVLFLVIGCIGALWRLERDAVTETVVRQPAVSPAGGEVVA